MMSRHKHTGFSLIELLLAIFILALGIISIAALFPAGISQQQKAADEVVGSIVAQNALRLSALARVKKILGMLQNSIVVFQVGCVEA